MPGIARQSLRGYVLEELLAALIQNTGYRLLVDESQDAEELQNLVNGLGVRGRGGVHQVDVLGELAWIPAFTFPIRLIVEAKARNGASGIDDVRNAVGLVTDVNQNYSRSSSGSRALIQKFSYRYALFSTSGFSRRAADYALAHQISLIDLSAPDFADLIDVADQATSALWNEQDPPGRAEGYVRRLRTWMRHQLGTWPTEVYSDWSDLEVDSRWSDAALLLRRGLAQIGELFIGMANGPYLLVLRANDPHAAVRALDANPVRDVGIHWSRRAGGGTHWTIEPVDGSGLTFTFTLPEALADWIFDEDADARRRAMAVKQGPLSSITIYRFVEGRDRLYRLRFSREEVRDFTLRPGRRRARDWPEDAE